ncbi:MAG: hypothetical protein IJW54_00455 [Clostridia bacterium]|nr:hypothetical protein [Clostridia bacterium]
MKKTFKRFGALLLALTLACVMLFATSCGDSGKTIDPEAGRDDFIGDIGGVSETYVGSASEESYETADSAAEAFVQNELAGQSDAVVLETTSKGELSSTEVTELNIPTDVMEGALSVEKIEVAYALNSADYYSACSAESVTDTLNKNKVVTVYVIKYENDWKYFTPLPETGDTVSKSYYESVFDNEKYQNCTFKNDMKVYASASGGGQSFSMTINMSQLIKHADGKVYLEQRMYMEMPGVDNQETVIYAYMEEVDGRVVCYVKQGADSTEWNPTNLSTIGFSSLEQLTPFYDQYLDYTYFTKADFGFVLNKENAAKYLAQALEDQDLGVAFSNDDINMYAEYYVSDGALSGMRLDAVVSMSVSQSGQSMSIYEEVSTTTTCTNYGTTVVEKPFVE